MNRRGLHQWGPDLPDDFIDTRMTPKRVWRLLKLAIKEGASEALGGVEEQHGRARPSVAAVIAAAGGRNGEASCCETGSRCKNEIQTSANRERLEPDQTRPNYSAFYVLQYSMRREPCQSKAACMPT